MYKITLSNDVTIEHLFLNGNNFVSKNEVLPSMFADRLGKVIIDGPDGIHEVHGPMKLIQIQQYGDEWWFILEDKTPEEIRMENLEAATRQIMLTMAGGMSHV